MITVPQLNERVDDPSARRKHRQVHHTEEVAADRAKDWSVQLDLASDVLRCEPEGFCRDVDLNWESLDQVRRLKDNSLANLLHREVARVLKREHFCL